MTGTTTRVSALARVARPLLMLALVLGVLGMHALSTNAVGPDVTVAAADTSTPALGEGVPWHAAHEDVGTHAGHHGTGVVMLCGAMLLVLAAVALHRQPISRHVRRNTSRGSGDNCCQRPSRAPRPSSLAGLCLLRC